MLSMLSVVGLGAADLQRAGIFVICLVLAVSVHEFSHAFAAHKLGDPTPEAQGRLTLNPMAHADPIGTLALPIILALSSMGLLFGWGRPVETQPRHYTRKVTMRSGMALVAFAGPLSNLLLAFGTIAVLWGLALGGVLTAPLSGTHPVRLFFNLNLLLFVFNLIPIHPLDGGKVLGWLMGPRYQHVDDFLGRYGFIILIVLVVSPIPILGFLFGPVFAWGNWALNAVV
jgi:Zn-dependent protease